MLDDLLMNDPGYVEDPLMKDLPNQKDIEKKEPEQISLIELDKNEEGKNIWVDLNESDKTIATVHLAHLYETELANDLSALEEIKARIDTKTSEIKEFLEAHALGSFKTDLLNAVYKSATTATTIDTAMLKARYPEIAAECSKTGPKSSSLSIKLKTEKK